MKYLKRYNEAVDVVNNEHKSVIEDMLLDLRDLDFHTTCLVQDKQILRFGSIEGGIKIHITKDKEFKWNDISQVISDIANYLQSEGYEIVDFTSKDDTESKENPDDYEIKKIKLGHLWSKDPNDSSIKSQIKDYWQIPNVTKTSIYDPADWDTVSRWMFDIKFEKKKTNEELDPSTYLSAADKLKKLGHIRRPEVLTSYAKDIVQREKDAKKKRVFEEAKKLGEFQLKLESKGEVKIANFYLSLLFSSDYYKESLTEWLDGDRNSIWLQILHGVHPVGEEDAQALEWYFGDDISGYINSHNGIIWLQDIYINLTNSDYISEEGQKLPMTPTGQISIEGAEFSEVYFANRREAIKFKNLLVSLFEGDIEYVQPNGEDFKQDLIETICDNDERPVQLSELEDLIDKLRVTRLNNLYRD